MIYKILSLRKLWHQRLVNTIEILGFNFLVFCSFPPELHNLQQNPYESYFPPTLKQKQYSYYCWSQYHNILVQEEYTRTEFMLHSQTTLQWGFPWLSPRLWGVTKQFKLNTKISTQKSWHSAPLGFINEIAWLNSKNGYCKFFYKVMIFLYVCIFQPTNKIRTIISVYICNG